MNWKKTKKPKFKSGVFQVDDVNVGGVIEQIVRGGRDKFPLLTQGFRGIKQIGVIGQGSQGPAQALNLRDSLIGTGIKVKVGLREGSQSMEKARKAGFTEENDTLGEMYQVISESDLVILLISDAAQVENWQRISDAIKPGAILGLSHGFLLGHLDSIGREGNPFDDHYSVIGVCPKGMGPSVRLLYVQGKEVNGAGVNCSFAVEQDLDGRAADVAIAWAIAIGAPFVFHTTLRDEYRSDLVGERCILLGGVHGMLEALYRYFIETGNMSSYKAFVNSVEQVTGVLSPIISKRGIIGVYEALPEADRSLFAKAFHSAYQAYLPLISEVYDEVVIGNEIRSVVMAGARLEEFPMGKIDGTPMWKIGSVVRAERASGIFNLANQSIHPVTAGFYCAMMIAQIEVLLKNDHCMSEICNESVIEAVDSLNPFMHARGVAHMVDNCSRTARLGTRKWGPRFDHITMQQALVSLYDNQPVDAWFDSFIVHPIHGALATCATLRPPVDIAVV